MHALALVARGLCSNVSGQQLGTLFRFLYTEALTLSAFAAVYWVCFPTPNPHVEVLCQLCFEILCAGDTPKGLVVEGIAGGNPVPLLEH